jgi:cyanophycin synthetase
MVVGVEGTKAPSWVGPVGPDEEGAVGSSDFAVSKFYVYGGPSYYLDRKAMVFNLHLNPNGKRLDHYLPAIRARFPRIGETKPERLENLFAHTLIEILKLDMDLFIHRHSVSRDGDEFVIAVEYFDADTVEDAAVLAAEWMRALALSEDFDFEAGFDALKKSFDRTLYGGPTAYSLIEAGLKRDIPVFYLPIEREMQWGYGRRQLRGRSTVLHTDGIKDTEFTTFKDDVKAFLEQADFPTPGGTTCHDLKEALAEAARIGYPVVAKPVAGHKGKGVFTNLRNDEALAEAYAAIKASLEGGKGPDGVIVERFIAGFDHRLLTVDGKFAAALERIPAHVTGDGAQTIEALIAIENSREIRASHARAPLAKIVIDEDLVHFLAGQDLTISSVPEKDHRVYLRRVANISAGGVSINVTDRIHPDNVALCEDIAKFFTVTCLGIDVLAADIACSWSASSFAIIEINAGPGVFMHLAPAVGEPIDVPGLVMRSHFRGESDHGRIPIIAGHNLSRTFCRRVEAALGPLPGRGETAFVTRDGLYFNGRFFCKNEHHDVNVMLALRNPRLGFALFNHDKDAWLDYGSFHQGADIAVLNGPHAVEEQCLRRDVLSGGHVIEAREDRAVLTRGGEEIAALPLGPEMDREDAIFQLMEPLLPALVARYAG